MSNNTPMDKAQHHASNALAFIGLGVLIIMNILDWRAHAWTDWRLQVLSILGTGFFAVINFKNTVEENSAWKSYGAFLFAMAVAYMYWIPLGNIAVPQP